MATPLLTAQKSIDAIAAKSDSVVLFCSLGKDSLVLLDLIYPRFKRIVCVFMYFVKGIDHIDRYAKWVKAKYPRIEFEQIPHWGLTHILRGGVYCVANPKVRRLMLKDVIEATRLKFDIHYVFLGMKKADSLNRRLMLMPMEKDGYERKGLVYPLADWTQKHILAYMRQKGLPEPVRYGKNASGGVGFNLDCFIWMRKNDPNGLSKVLKAFPMSERILFEYDYNQNQETGDGAE